MMKLGSSQYRARMDEYLAHYRNVSRNIRDLEDNVKSQVFTLIKNGMKDYGASKIPNIEEQVEELQIDNVDILIHNDISGSPYYANIDEISIENDKLVIKVNDDGDLFEPDDFYISSSRVIEIAELAFTLLNSGRIE